MDNFKKRLIRKGNGARRGFTLVELLVVIAIIAILSVTAYVALGGQTAKARNSKRMQDLSSIQNALEIYFVENYSKYPLQLEDDAIPATIELSPKYMPVIPVDPIPGNPYVYAVAANAKTFQLAATLEEEDGSYKAYVIGNGSGLITTGVESPSCAGACLVENGSTNCVPYCP